MPQEVLDEGRLVYKGWLAKYKKWLAAGAGDSFHD
jgi:hypothetical protein